MAQKANRKKAAYQRLCREQVRKGLINQPDGNWAPARSDKAMDRDMQAGYRLGRK